MVAGRLCHPEDEPFRCLVGDVPVRGHRELGDRGVEPVVGVVDEEPAVGGVVRVERQPEHAHLPAEVDVLVDVQEGWVEPLTVLDDPDPPCLIDDEQPIVTRRSVQEDGLRDAGCHLLEGEGRVVEGFGGCSDGRHRGLG